MTNHDNYDPTLDSEFSMFPETMNALLARSTWLRIGSLIALILAAFGLDLETAQSTGQAVADNLESIGLALLAIVKLSLAALERAKGTRALTLFGIVLSSPGEG